MQTQDNTETCYRKGIEILGKNFSATLQVEIDPLVNKVGLHEY